MRAASMSLLSALVLGGCWICPGFGHPCTQGETIVVEGPLADGDYVVRASASEADTTECAFQLVCSDRAPSAPVCTTTSRNVEVAITCADGRATFTVMAFSAGRLVTTRPSSIAVTLTRPNGSVVATHTIALRRGHDDEYCGGGGEGCYPIERVDL